jgi:DNA polymerase III epsilon subunit-like protein
MNKLKLKPVLTVILLGILNSILTPNIQAQSQGQSQNQESETFPGMLALDCEMGGLNENTDALISIGAAYSDYKTPENIQKREFIINPTQGLKYTKGAFKVNGFKLIEPSELDKSETLISNSKNKTWLKLSPETGGYEEVQSKNEKDAMLDLINFLTKDVPQNAPLAGCNIGFDIKFLKKAALRVGLEKEMNKALNRPIIDIQDLAVVAHKEGKITLPPTAKQLAIDKNTKKFSTSLDSIAIATKSQARNPHGFHDGLEDALITKECAVNLTKFLDLNSKEDLKNLRIKKKLSESKEKNNKGKKKIENRKKASEASEASEDGKAR